MLSLIACIGTNNSLGKDNRMPWHLPNDLKRFKRITQGHPIIMGRKTFLSLPGLLPKRRHIVLTRDPSFQINDARVTVVHSLEDLFRTIDDQEENFVIGGGQIYAQLLPYADRLYLTIIDREFEADTYFPHVDYSRWRILEKNQGIKDEANPYPHTFITYQKI